MTPKQFAPRDYQNIIIDHILQHPRCGVWAGMGMGKSVSTLTAIDILNLVQPGLTLAIAPLRVASSTWPEEADKWEHLENIKVSPVIGSIYERRAALRRDANVFTINYENLPWLLEEYGTNWPFTKVVADESTKLKSFRTRQGGKRAHALAMVAHSKVKRFIELTGTPSPNGLADLWGQAWYLDRGNRLGKTFSAFEKRWFQKIQVGSDRFATRLEPLPHAQREIEDALRDLCVSLNAKDYFDISEPITHVVEVELPEKARKLYKAMEKDMYIDLNKNTAVEAFDAGSKTMKCLQLASGAIYTNEKNTEWAEVHDAKLQALEEIVGKAAGMPVLVAYHFKSDLVRLKKAFPKGRELDQNPKTIKDWNAGKIPLLFAHPASAGHGLNLQDGGNIIAFFTHWWDLEQFQQIIERIGPTRQAQAGHDRPVFVYHIVARGTVDNVVMKRRDTKRAIQELLMENLKAKGY